MSSEANGSKRAVFLIASGALSELGVQTGGYIQRQGDAVKSFGWDAVWGRVTDRTSLFGVLRNICRLRRELKQCPADVVHGQYGSILGLVACIVAGRRPYVVSFGGDDLLGTPNPGLSWRLRSFIARVASLLSGVRARAIIVKSQNLLSALPFFLQRKVRVIPNGVDLDLFAPVDQAKVRLKLGWRAEELVVLFNGSVRSNRVVKNLPLAEEAVVRLKKRIPTARLEVVASLSVAEMLERFNGADALLVTSLHEGSPNIVKEAMSCNLPVVSVDCGDVAERLADVNPGGVCGYDADELAIQLERVLMGRDRSNGRDALVAQGLDLRRTAERVVGIYDEVLGR